MKIQFDPKQQFRHDAVTLKAGADIFELSECREVCLDGFAVNEINAEPGTNSFVSITVEPSDSGRNSVVCGRTSGDRGLTRQSESTPRTNS